MKIKSATQRYNKKKPHDPRSLKMMKELMFCDYTFNNDFHGLKIGGDGDNGEDLLYLLDIWFESKDKGVL